jgi:oxaloacetate decarboxylase (Na+ extruding) subunit alpha
MTTMELVDQTIRDGQQSLWGMRMRPGHALPVLPLVNAVGYPVVDYAGGSNFEVLVRRDREDPWEGLDLIRAALPSVKLRSGLRSNGMVGMGLAPNAILEHFIRTLAKHGVNSFWLFDCLYNMDQMRWMANVAMDCGMAVSPQVQFGDSPVHTDDFFADVVTQMSTWNVGTITIGDESGILLPDRARTLLPRLLAAAGTTPVEAHFHNTVGLADGNYLIAAGCGMTRLHTAVGPMGGGVSLPSAALTVANLRRSGHQVDVNDELFEPIGAHFERIAKHNGFAMGHPEEFNVRHTQHQLPGGMTGTLLAQLRTYGLEHKYEELLDEIIIVRGHMGYPIMATPYSQLVASQALLNVVNGERYTVFPDENLMYLAGHMGRVPGPLNPEMMDRAFSTAHGAEFRNWVQPQPTIKEIRSRFGENVSAEELLLRYLMPASDVDAMLASGPVVRDLTPRDNPQLDLARQLIGGTDVAYASCHSGDFSLQLARSGRVH